MNAVALAYSPNSIHLAQLAPATQESPSNEQERLAQGYHSLGESQIIQSVVLLHPNPTMPADVLGPLEVSHPILRPEPVPDQENHGIINVITYMELTSS